MVSEVLANNLVYFNYTTLFEDLLANYTSIFSIYSDLPSFRVKMLRLVVLYKQRQLLLLVMAMSHQNRPINLLYWNLKDQSHVLQIHL